MENIESQSESQWVVFVYDASNGRRIYRTFGRSAGSRDRARECARRTDGVAALLTQAQIDGSK